MLYFVVLVVDIITKQLQNGIKFRVIVAIIFIAFEFDSAIPKHQCGVMRVLE